jgi:lipopolysaccharide export system permease protein
VKILDRYILKSFITTFLTVFVILFLIFILQTVWLFIGELAGKDLDVSLIFKFLLFKMPSVVPLVLPLSIVLASIMTFGSFAENYEFAAMKSAGISLTRAMRGLSLFILILSLATFAFANNVIPYAEYKFINFRRNIAQVKPAMAIAEGQFSDIGTYNIKVDKKSGENGNKLSGITIHKKSSQDVSSNTVVIQAKSGELVSNEDSNILKLVLNDGYYYEDIVPKKIEDKKKMPFAKSSFKKYIINIDLSKLNKTDLTEEQITNTNTMLNVGELNYTIDSLSQNYDKDIVSFTDNIYQRTGVSALRKMPLATPTPANEKTPDLLSLVNSGERDDIIRVATSNVSGTIFSIDGSKLEMENKLKNINNHYIALYDKFVIAFACFLMFFIGAPLGAIIRKGGLGLPIVFAVLIFIVFHFVNTFGKKVAQENGISPFLGTWMSTLILAPLAILLTYRATKDMSVSLSFDWITIPVRKLFPKKQLQPAIAGAENIDTGEDVDWRKLDLLADTALFDIVRNPDEMHYTPAYQSKAQRILVQRGHSFDEPIQVSGKRELSEADLLTVSDLIGIYNLYAITALASNIVAIAAWIITNKNPAFLSVALIALALLFIAKYQAWHLLKRIGHCLQTRIGVGLALSLVLAPFYIFVYFYNRAALKRALAK